MRKLTVKEFFESKEKLCVKVSKEEYENTLSERNIQITTNFENKEINNRNELIERIKGAVND